MQPRHYRSTQIANIFTPGLGFILSIPGLVLLVVASSRNADAWRVASCAIYGASLVISYASFTIYHLLKFHPRYGKFSRILDHSTIYLLIAGTYTPFTLVFMRGNWGWTLFTVVWGLALAGIFCKLFFIHRFKILTTLLYLAMGWLLIFAAKPAIALIPPDAFRLLFAGGVAYSSGLIFYAWKKLLFHHAIWHLFVFAGSLLHYLAVLWYVVPLPPA